MVALLLLRLAEERAGLLRVALAVAGELALPARVVALVAGAALVRVVQVRALPRVVTDVSAPRTCVSD